jgi:hypothetical protein
MAKLKRTTADSWFSKCVRERSNWTCDRCNKHYPDDAAKGSSRSLDCSHVFGRGNWSVRHDPDNAFCHCYGCHSIFGSDKEVQQKEYNRVFGGGLYDMLVQKKNDSSRGRVAKRSNKEMAKHYKAEFERMRGLRLEGEQGRIEFEGFI